MTMPAFTIRPPWSQLIAETAAFEALGIDPKRVENRGQRIAPQHIGQTVAIHAGLRWDDAAARDIRVRNAWQAFSDAIDLHKPNPRLAAIGDTRTGVVGGLAQFHLPHLWIEQGAVVAVAVIAGCHPARQGFAHDGPTCCQPWGNRWHYTASGEQRTAWHIELGDVRRLRTPVPARGSLAMPWKLPPAVTEQVLAQLGQTSTTPVAQPTPS